MNEKKMTKRYGSRSTAIKSDMDKPTASTKGLDDAVSKIGAKTKQGMSDAGSFGSAFKAARSSGDKTFTWHGKSYSTKTAGDKPSAPAKRAAPAAKPAAAAAPAKPATPAAKPAASKSAPPAPQAKRQSTSGGLSTDRYSAALRSGVIPGNASEEEKKQLRSTMATTRAAKLGLAPVKPKSTVDAETAMYRRKNQNPYARENMKKGGSVKKFAKGGSIDGCAVRGKTKAR